MAALGQFFVSSMSVVMSQEASPPSGCVVHEKLTPRFITTEDVNLAQRPAPSLVSWALVRRRQRWRPPLRRRAELVGRPHGGPYLLARRLMAYDGSGMFVLRKVVVPVQM